MPNFEDIATQEQPQSILLYGRSKVGKTELIASLANAGYKVIYVDIESGKQTLIHAIKPECRKNLTYIKIPDTTQNPIGIQTVGKMLEAKGDFEICWAHGVYNCPNCKATKSGTDKLNLVSAGSETVFVLETATQLSSSANAYTMRKEFAKIWNDFEKTDWDKFNYQGNLLDMVFSMVQQMNCHRIVTTHEEIIDTNSAEKIAMIMPKAGTRNYARNFGRFFDHIVYAYLSNGKHKVASATNFNSKVLTGSRSAINIDLASEGLVSLLRSGAEAYQKSEAASAKTKVDYIADTPDGLEASLGSLTGGKLSGAGASGDGNGGSGSGGKSEDKKPPMTLTEMIAAKKLGG